MQVLGSFLLLVFLTAAQCLVSRNALREEWEAFKVKHGKMYNDPVEEKFRNMIFVENWNKIERHNKKYERGESSFRMGMNRFGDWLSHEIAATMNGYRQRANREDASNATTFLPLENVQEPSKIDWVKKGYVTPVKDQGDCGSCWTFSATGSLEGQHKRKTGKLISLSEQNLVDCAGKYGNAGCNGGLPEMAFQYINDNNGIDTEESYPYEAHDGKCRFKRSKVGATDKGHVLVEPGNEKKLRKAVGTVGPVSVGIDASLDSFGLYKDGIYDDPQCSSDELGHAVLVVGYDADKGKKYWLVKNSWGEGWGMSGYIRMSRDKKNQCGIATEPSYPVV